MDEDEVADQQMEDSNEILSQMKILNQEFEQLSQAEVILLQRLKDLKQDEIILRDALPLNHESSASAFRQGQIPVDTQREQDILKNLQNALMCDDSSSNSSSDSDGDVEESDE